jgi:putative ABC transport system permease protein
VNLALRDVRYRLGRFLLTAFGLGLLLATVMAMGGIYQGLVVEALSIVRASGADLWVVQKDTNGPFAETSRVPDDLSRVIRAVPGVAEASPIALQSLQFRVGPKPFRVQLVGHRLGALGSAPAVVAGRPILYSRYEMVLGREAGVPLGTEIRIGRMIFTVVGLTESIVSNAGDPAPRPCRTPGDPVQGQRGGPQRRARVADLQSASLANVPLRRSTPSSNTTRPTPSSWLGLADPHAVSSTSSAEPLPRADARSRKRSWPERHRAGAARRSFRAILVGPS